MVDNFLFDQGGKEERQAGEEDPGQSGAGLLGRVPASPGPGQHHGDGHQEDVQAERHLRPGAGHGRHREDRAQPAQKRTSCSAGNIMYSIELQVIHRFSQLLVKSTC